MMHTIGGGGSGGGGAGGGGHGGHGGHGHGHGGGGGGYETKVSILSSSSEALMFERGFRNEVAHGCELVRQLEHNLKQAAPGSLAKTILSNGPMPEFFYTLAKIANIFTNSMISMTHYSSNHNHNHQIIANNNTKEEEEEEEEEKLACLKMKLPKKRIDTKVVMPILDSPSKVDISPQSGEHSSSSKHEVFIDAIDQSTNESLCLDGGDNHDEFPSCMSPTKKRKKTKLTHTTIIKVRSNELDHMSKEVPKDGYVWNKYGQKGINLAAHPRSYYRCARFRDARCLAKKQVQRSNEDSSIFVVTYQGNHTCLPQPIWEFPYILSLPEIALHYLHNHTSKLGSVLENCDTINNIFKVESPLANCQEQMGLSSSCNHSMINGLHLNQECMKIESTLMPSTKSGFVNSGAPLIDPKRDSLLNANSHAKQVNEVTKTLKQHETSILASGNNKGKGISNTMTHELHNDHNVYHHDVPHPYQELAIKQQDHDMTIFSPNTSEMVSRNMEFEIPLMMEGHLSNETMQSIEVLLESQVDLSINYVTSLEESSDWFYDEFSN